MSTLKDYLQNPRPHQFSLNSPHLSLEKQHHLSRLYKSGGLKNKLLILPIDHGVEHGPEDFLDCPWASDPIHSLEIAKQGKLSAIASHIGFAEKYWQKDEFRNSVPLILKLNGKTNIPWNATPLAGITGTVEDALDLGAEAVGYTLYVGSERQDEDFREFNEIRLEAKDAGLPLFVWAYPRGDAVEEQGGQNSLSMISYAARLANELGADFCKVNFPKANEEEKKSDLTDEEKLKWIIFNAGVTGVLLSGGEKMEDNKLLERIRIANKAEIDGFMLGRNLFSRSFEEAMKLIIDIKEILGK